MNEGCRARATPSIDRSIDWFSVFGFVVFVCSCRRCRDDVVVLAVVVAVVVAVEGVAAEMVVVV